MRTPRTRHRPRRCCRDRARRVQLLRGPRHRPLRPRARPTSPRPPPAPTATVPPATDDTLTAAAPAGEVRVHDSSVGPILVDGRSKALYVFPEDTAGQAPTCVDAACTEKWPPVLAGDLEADGVDAALFGTVTQPTAPSRSPSRASMLHHGDRPRRRRALLPGRRGRVVGHLPRRHRQSHAALTSRRVGRVSGRGSAGLRAPPRTDGGGARSAARSSSPACARSRSAAVSCGRWTSTARSGSRVAPWSPTTS